MKFQDMKLVFFKKTLPPIFFIEGVHLPQGYEPLLGGRSLLPKVPTGAGAHVN